MKKRLEQLDFLRGLALVGVIAVHVLHEYPSVFPDFFDWVYQQGQHGVELFFAVSGYTMMMMYASYAKRWDAPLKVFYIKRLLRIYPLFFAAGFAYLPLSIDPSHSDPNGTSVGDIVRVMTLTGGFDPYTLNAVVPGGWTITNEMYFYLIFPLVFLAINKFNLILLSSLLVFINVVLCAAVKFLVADGIEHKHLIQLFFYRNLTNQIFLFLAGMLAYKAVRGNRDEFLKFIVPVGVAGAGLSIAMGYHMLIQTTVLAIICFYAIKLLFKLENFKGYFFTHMGRVTYTGYIIHFGLIEVFVWGAFNLGLHSYMVVELVLPVMVVLTYVCSKALVPITELLWQKIADRICQTFPARSAGA